MAYYAHSLRNAPRERWHSLCRTPRGYRRPRCGHRSEMGRGSLGTRCRPAARRRQVRTRVRAAAARRLAGRSRNSRRTARHENLWPPGEAARLCDRWPPWRDARRYRSVRALSTGVSPSALATTPDGLPRSFFQPACLRLELSLDLVLIPSSAWALRSMSGCECCSLRCAMPISSTRKHSTPQLMGAMCLEGRLELSANWRDS